MEFFPKLIIGLGNPDKKYQNTYHNVGHMAADYLAGEKTIKSDTHMNESGKFVAKALKKYGVKSGELLIIHDDSDIELGKYKFSFGRGAAGHHGVESVQQALKTKNFWRLRIGVRSAADQRGTERGPTRKKAGEFVLKKISAADKKTLGQVFDKIAKSLLWGDFLFERKLKF